MYAMNSSTEGKVVNAEATPRRMLKRAKDGFVFIEPEFGVRVLVFFCAASENSLHISF